MPGLDENRIGWTMDFDEYQRRAAVTNQMPSSGPQNAVAPMLGLASETGAILNVYKKFLRDKIDLAANADYLEEELGDLLWYAAAVATAFDLSLSEIAAKNLERTHDYFLPSDHLRDEIRALPPLDQAFPAEERLPRRMEFVFTETIGSDGHPIARVCIVLAEPYAFAGGLQMRDGKKVGFQLGDALGAELTDNSRRADAYRFHDAIHIGFAAVLGWSPVLRRLLRLKRRSNKTIDDSEDGARAIFAEEGLATMLSQLAVRRLFFQTELSVDMETIDVAKVVVANLESSSTPAWLWRRAINQAFLAFHQLEHHHGGRLIADLDERSLTFHAPEEGETGSG
jgi:NTP pyrophosphatase (non-canonical NTP hydrolase)